MVKLVQSIEAFFLECGSLKSLALGVAIGGSVSLMRFLTGSVAISAFAFVVYFPLHAWLTVSLFLVVFSIHARERLLGSGWNFLQASFLRMFSPFGLFCMGWFLCMAVFGA